MKVRVTANDHYSTLYGSLEQGREVDVSDSLGKHWVANKVAEPVDGAEGFDDVQDRAREETELTDLRAAARGRDPRAVLELDRYETYLTERRAMQENPEANVTPEQMQEAAKSADSDATDAESGAAGKAYGQSESAEGANQAGAKPDEAVGVGPSGDRAPDAGGNAAQATPPPPGAPQDQAQATPPAQPPSQTPPPAGAPGSTP